MKSGQKNNLLSYSFLLLAQVMVGVCIVATKSMLTTIPAIAILTIRFSIGFIFVLIMHLILEKNTFHELKKLTKMDWVFIIAQALCAGVFFNILLLAGLKYTSASVTGIITSALPAITAIFSLIFLRERFTLSTIGCILFSVLGLVIINFRSIQSLSITHFIGELLILLALLPEAAYYILNKCHKNKLPVFLVSTIMNGINIPLFFIILFSTHTDFSYTISPMQYMLLSIIGIGTGLFHVFWFLGSKHLHASAAGLTTAFMPLTALILAFIFLGETISLYQGIGMILVIVAIFFNAMKNKYEVIHVDI